MFDQSKYSADYNRQNYDRFTLCLPKGYKSRIKDLAAIKGQSMTQWIQLAIDNAIEHQEDAYTRKD